MVRFYPRSAVEGVVLTLLITQEPDIFHFGAQLFAANAQKDCRLALVEPGFFKGAEYGLALERRQVEGIRGGGEYVIALLLGDFGG